jgi:hypothetical protein
MTLDAQALTPSRRRFPRYWSLNMTLARTFGWVWMPGFTYGPDEWRRFEALAAAIPRRAVMIWLFATALIFVLLAAVVMIGVLGVALTVLWPNPTDMPEAGFFALLIAVIVLAIGFGMPLSIVWGGAIADWLEPGTPAVEAADDGALYAKIGRQFRRMSDG